MAAAEVTAEIGCDWRDCRGDAVVHCIDCNKLFCETHHETHEAYWNNLNSTHEFESVENYCLKTRIDNSQFCDQHKTSLIIVGCEFCYKPICSKCLDDKIPERSTCSADCEGNHSTRSAKQVALKIQTEIKEMMSELRVKELTHANDMKERRKTYDEMEENRTDLDKLSAKVQQLHNKLDEFADEIRNELVAHMKLKEEIMQKYESDYSEYQKNCQEIHEQISEFSKLENEAVLKNQQMMRDKLIPLKSLKLEHQPLPAKPTIKFKGDEHFNIPIQLIVTPAVIPKSLQHKESIDVKSPRVVQYLQDGRLIYAGDNSLLVGFDFTPDIPSGDILSLCEHNNNLYILQYLISDKNLHVHVINLNNHSVRRSVLSCSGTSSHQQLAVNDDYVIFGNDLRTPTIRVYSSQNLTHKLDIKLDSMEFAWVWGKAFLDDTLVIGDYSKHKVCNITISSPSTVRWTCSIAQPTTIRVCSQVVLVGSHEDSSLIYVLSNQGEKLSTIEVPQATTGVTDLFRFGNRLVTMENCGGYGGSLDKIHIHDVTDEDSSGGV